MVTAKLLAPLGGQQRGIGMGLVAGEHSPNEGVLVLEARLAALRVAVEQKLVEAGRGEERAHAPRVEGHACGHAEGSVAQLLEGLVQILHERARGLSHLASVPALVLQVIRGLCPVVIAAPLCVFGSKWMFERERLLGWPPSDEQFVLNWGGGGSLREELCECVETAEAKECVGGGEVLQPFAEHWDVMREQLGEALCGAAYCPHSGNTGLLSKPSQK